MTSTLSIDIGGSGLKASVLDDAGQFLVPPVRVPTPNPVDPSLLLATLAQLVAPLPRWDRISVGFPGVVRHGVVRAAANLGTEAFRGFDLAAGLADVLGAPTRVANDSEVQGYAAISGKGVEVVVTLGTGFGSSIFSDGRACAHLELAHHPFGKKRTYEEALGEAALDRAGKRKWRRRVRRAIEQLRVLTDFDHLYIGGGNARVLHADELESDVSVVDNRDGILGGIHLWQPETPPTERRTA
ncbi:MAG: ROK family protein [Gemmatimonadota bacterium]